MSRFRRESARSSCPSSEINLTAGSGDTEGGGYCGRNPAGARLAAGVADVKERASLHPSELPGLQWHSGPESAWFPEVCCDVDSRQSVPLYRCLTVSSHPQSRALGEAVRVGSRSSLTPGGGIVRRCQCSSGGLDCARDDTRCWAAEWGAVECQGCRGGEAGPRSDACGPRTTHEDGRHWDDVEAGNG